MLFKLLNFIFQFVLYYFKIYKNRIFYLNKKKKLQKKIITDLSLDGISIIPNYIDKKKITKIIRETKPHIKKLLKKPTNKMRYFRNSNMGIFRLYELKKISKSSKNIFFDASFLKNISKYYISKNVEFYQDMIEVRQPLKKKLREMKSSSDNYHFDDWKIRLKYFLILSDVTKDDAPMCYIKKSHKLMLFNKKFEYFYNGKSGNYGYFSNNEVKKLKKKYDLKEEICTCKVGTLIIVDTRGIHKGTPLRRINNPRIQLGLYSDTRQKKWNPKNVNI